MNASLVNKCANPLWIAVIVRMNNIVQIYFSSVKVGDNCTSDGACNPECALTLIDELSKKCGIDKKCSLNDKSFEWEL